MTWQGLRVLTDGDLDAEVVQWLIDSGSDVLDVCRAGLRGTSDVVLLRRAFAESRVVLTHDADFSQLAIVQGEPVHGIIFLRPGHIDPEFTIATLRGLAATAVDLQPPFLLVARRVGDRVTIRLRRLSS